MGMRKGTTSLMPLTSRIAPACLRGSGSRGALTHPSSVANQLHSHKSPFSGLHLDVVVLMSRGGGMT